jgi:hypothetical protein
VSKTSDDSKRGEEEQPVRLKENMATERVKNSKI